eukprot:TRINITY_DN13737_c0_g2_i1.p1 TRINITY_DN13737_c0_g2~~TRINITY_DN13737_c0_g2_i1.p1  ORF type:complete len:498 (+),score=143.42 TRINITY_DN13737_c0_g2_i1:81-1496(+)
MSKKNERRLMHVKELMVQKVSKRYMASTGEKLNTAKLAFITEEVGKLLTQKNPTDSDLSKVVHVLKVKFGRSRRSDEHDPRRTSSLPEVPRSAGEDKERGSSRQSENMAPHQPNSPPLGLYAQRNLLVREDMWARLSKKDQQDYEVEEAKRKKKTKERMLEQRKALDEQIRQQQVRKQWEHEEEEKVHKMEATKLESWKVEMELEEKKRKQASVLEKRDRDEQLKDLDRRKRAEEDLKKREEADIAKKIQTELEAEQQATVAKRLKAKDDIAKFMSYNAEQRQIKTSMKDKEMEEDRELHKMYVEKLEKQEREREESLRKLYARQSKQVALGSRIAAGLAERAAEDERRAAEEQRRMLEKVQNEEKRRQLAIVTEKEKIKMYLAQQIHEKERRKQQEKDDLVNLRDRMMADVKISEEQEKEKASMKRAKEVKNRCAIEDQIRTKHACTQEAMSNQERRINRQLLRRLSNNP